MRGFDGRVTKLQRRWAAYTTTVSTHNADNSWLAIGGYDTPFPGFAAADIANPGIPSFTYGLGVITANVSGWIRVHFMVEFVNDTTDPEGGRRGIRLLMSGMPAGSNAPSGNFQEGLGAAPLPLETFYNGPIAAGQTLTAQAFQQSGGNLDMSYRGLTIEFDPIA